MSVSGSPTLPITPIRKRADASPGAGLDYDVSPPSAMSSPGNTVNDGSCPATPVSPGKFPTNKSQTRRRGNTISTIADASLMKHAIFSLSSPPSEPKKDSFEIIHDGGDKKGICVAELESRMNMASIQDDEKIYVDQVQGRSESYSPMANEARNMGNTEDSLLASVGDGGPDSKDLARNGLPSACVFVANLAASQADEQLMKNLKAHFSRFGRVHVKIRRDGKGNPYSFCQFETDEAAKTAVREGRNAIVDSTGRRIRCEPAKVNRTLVVSKYDGSAFDETEARKMLHGFGGTEALEFAIGMNSLPVRGLKEGKRCFVRFIYRQDAVDCYQYFHFHGNWIAEWTSNFSSSNNIPRIRTVEIDALSIFVGKLNPNRISEPELLQRFGKYGNIQECNLFNKPGAGRTAFAFIKYGSEEEATAAIANEDGSNFLGSIIHVQKREIHKKHIRSPFASTRQHQGTNKTEEAAYPSGSDTNMTVPSFSFSLKDVADLAARLSVQIASQHGLNRHQSMASILSDAGVPATPNPLGFPFPPESISARRASFLSNASGAPSFMFHHPFQANRGFAGSLPTTPMTPDAPLSPRAGHATFPRAVDIQHEDGCEGTSSGSYVMASGSGHHNSQFGSATGDSYWGAFPPNQHQNTHLLPHFSMNDPYRRDSTASFGYEVPMLYGPHADGLSGQMHVGYHSS